MDRDVAADANGGPRPSPPEAPADLVRTAESVTSHRTGPLIVDRRGRMDRDVELESGLTTALRDANGHIRAFAKILRDNTDRKVAEAARLEVSDELRRLTDVLAARTPERDR